MTWTYTANPATVTIDAVRFLVGDTDEYDPLVQDEEINFAIALKGPGYGAAWVIANALAAKFTRQVTASAGGISTSASERASQYTALAATMYNMLASGVVPSFGGVSVTQKQGMANDSGKVQPSFTRSQYDNPEAMNENTIIDRNGGIT